MTDEELEKLAARIAMRVWRRIRTMVRKHQREIFDFDEEEDDG